MALTVIGSGLPRTGTLSLKAALTQLGFGPCHHMLELVTHPERMALWVAAGDGGADWDAIFDGYHSTTDAPACYFWRELVERYPTAKVVHSVRDPDTWLSSFQALASANSSVVMSPERRRFAEMTAKRRPDHNDRDAMLDWFKRQTEDVTRAIPTGRLLVFEAAQGWPPLCAFLGVPVPETPFPRLNEREAMAAAIAQSQNPDGTINADRLREALASQAKAGTPS